MSDPYKLWYGSPAECWEETLPLGNGHLGAMVWGGPQTERIGLNEITLWSGYEHSKDRPDTLDALPEVRALIFAGEYYRAQQLLEQRMLGEFTESYLPLGNLSAEFAPCGQITGYSRELSLADACVRVRYTQNGALFTRTAFASHPHRALILRYDASMAGLAAFGATLTLPGIAGIILTIAMAVDANVLIYERIREELRLGLKPADAVHKGYDRATLAIIDSNTTNVLVAIILYQFGTGPIRGFAVTMHLAAALGVPVLATFLSSAWCFETGPYGLGHQVLQSVADCLPCLESAPCEVGVRCLRPFGEAKLTRFLATGKPAHLPDGLLAMESAFDELGLTFRPLAGIDDHDALRRQFRVFLSRHLGVGKNWTAPVVLELVERLYAEHDWVVPEPESSANRLLWSVADDM